MPSLITHMFRCWRVLSSVVGMQHWTNLDSILNYVGVVFGTGSLPELWFLPLVSWKFWVFSYTHFGIWLCSYSGSIWIVSGLYSPTVNVTSSTSINSSHWLRKPTRPFLPRTPLALAHHTSLIIIWADTVLPVHGVLAQLMIPCTGFEFCSIIVHTLTWYYRLMRNNIPPIFWYCAENMLS